jgi:2'-5' RNA ligase
MREHDDRHGRGGSDVPRLFVAVPVPPDVGLEVGRVMGEARAALGEDGGRIRWVQLEGLHLTLRFLGPTMADRVPDVEAALDRAAAGEAAFEVRLAGAGAFPSADRPRALWLGIQEGSAALGRLATGLEAGLRVAGWAVETRAYRPHLTIARTDGVRAGPAAAAALERAAADLDAGFTAGSVVLYRSHLGSGPARYEALREARLS